MIDSDKPVSAEYRCRKCGDSAEVKFSYASSNDCCRKVPCVRPGNGPCDMPARQSPSKSISDAMMDLVDRLGHEWKDVDPRAWSRLLIYAPSVEQDERGAFEAWMRNCDGYPYAGQYANLMWKAWQARAASTSANVAQGWKLVPIVPTDDMEIAAENDYEDTGATFPDWKSAYRAMLAAAPAQVANVAQGAEAVGERIARALHYPACWDTAAYPTLESAAWEAIACAKLGCSTCGELK